MSTNLSFPTARRTGRTLSVLASALLLASCATSGGLEPSAVLRSPDDVSATRSLAGHLSQAEFPRQDWWTRLGDPQLDALIGEALAGTPSLQVADARLRQARAQAGLSDAERRPSLSGSAQYTGVQLPETLLGDEFGGKLMHSTVLMLNFSWKPDLWGGQRAAYEAAVGQARAAEVDAQAARLALSANIARAYINLAQAYEAQQVARQEERRASQLFELGDKRVKAGLDNQLPLRQSESAIASARQQAEAAQQQIDALRNALAALLGKGPDRGLDIAPPSLLDAPSPAVPNVLPSELLGHRADVVAARWRVEAASRGIDAAKAAFKPSINLSAIVGLADSGLSDLFSNEALLGFGGPALSLPIFDGGRLRGQLDARDAQYDLAVAEYNQSLVGAMHEVADAVQAARSLDAQTAQATQARDAARAALELATSRYSAGIGNQLEVLTTQRPLLQLEQQLASLRAQRYAAAIDLDQALGGGLPLSAPQLSSSDSDTSKVTP
ncbi:efflux transporter outer membrane subunit [Pseudoxanthomonas composti]|uniref:Efflux transporter outer membrane subunit n=1 Tax=Pseudoxanthomonas composti TaxID=2137479 RepID=A0A4V1N1H5_9GAMM|nr:efflux transporter outer membrane subunit [Pseudoxanthomonas composti]RXR08318.1 efflux transporter outer membrane subunit [Pseudoxanthomonas composti]